MLKCSTLSSSHQHVQLPLRLTNHRAVSEQRQFYQLCPANKLPPPHLAPPPPPPPPPIPTVPPSQAFDILSLHFAASSPFSLTYYTSTGVSDVTMRKTSTSATRRRSLLVNYVNPSGSTLYLCSVAVSSVPPDVQPTFIRDGKTRGCWSILIVPFSALEQTHCALVACDSKRVTTFFCCCFPSLFLQRFFFFFFFLLSTEVMH